MENIQNLIQLMQSAISPIVLISGVVLLIIDISFSLKVLKIQVSDHL